MPSDPLPAPDPRALQSITPKSPCNRKPMVNHPNVPNMTSITDQGASNTIGVHVVFRHDMGSTWAHLAIIESAGCWRKPEGACGVGWLCSRRSRLCQSAVCIHQIWEHQGIDTMKCTAKTSPSPPHLAQTDTQ